MQTKPVWISSFHSLPSHRVDASLVLEHVKAHGLRQGSALSNRHDVSLLHVLPARRAVNGHVRVALLEPLHAGKTDRGEG